MFRDMSIQKKLNAGFGAIVAIIIVLLLAAHYNLTRFSEANALDRHTLTILIEVDEVEMAIVDMQNNVRGFLLTGRGPFLDAFNQAESELPKHFQQAEELLLDQAQIKRLKAIEPMVKEWLSTTARPLLQKRHAINQKSSSLEQLGNDPLLLESPKRVNEIRKRIKEFNIDENRILEQRSAQSEKLRRDMTMLLTGGGLACILIAIAVAYLLKRAILVPISNLATASSQIANGNQAARAAVISQDELGKVSEEFNRMAQAIQDTQAREQEATNQLRSKVDALLGVVSKATAGDLTGTITVTGNDAIGQLGDSLAIMFDNLRKLLNRVQKAGIQVTTSTTEIAASSKQQEATGVEQAQTSIEVLSTTKEISANTSQLVKAMEEVSQIADYTSTTTADAQTNLKRMDQTMQRMVSATDSINAKLAALSEKASNINNVLTTITKVADQTNILSLNAAIEAEKAGEAGRGFSVVATEIRRLADQTSVATWDIEQMLKEMQSAVSASVMGMDKFSEEIRRSVDETRLVSEHLSTVIGQVQKLTPRFDLVFEGMQSQSVGASQITETMTQLNEATQQAVDSLKATSEAVQQLQYAAQDLQASVSTFAVNL